MEGSALLRRLDELVPRRRRRKAGLDSYAGLLTERPVIEEEEEQAEESWMQGEPWLGDAE